MGAGRVESFLKMSCIEFMQSPCMVNGVYIFVDIFLKKIGSEPVFGSLHELILSPVLMLPFIPTIIFVRLIQ